MNRLAKNRNVLVVGHADADGHLAAEQSRRNLETAGARRCDVLVEPQVTRSYRFWEQHLPTVGFGDAEFIVFVDLMMNPREPDASLKALFARAEAEPTHNFLVIDHHQINESGAAPSNVSLMFVPTVFLCCYGMPSDLMVIAALCDDDEASIRHLATSEHYRRASAMKRAAADTRGMAGERLLRLLRHDRWDIIEPLADDPPDAHRTARGVRISQAPVSPALELARGAAGAAAR